MKASILYQTLRRMLLCSFAFTVLSISSLSAQRGPQSAPAEREQRPDVSSEDAETMMFGRLAQMNDEQLKRLRAAIDEILEMTPDERAEASEAAITIREQRAARVREHRETRSERIQEIPPRERAAMRERLREITPEERVEMRQQMRDLTPEERVEMMRQRQREREKARD